MVKLKDIAARAGVSMGTASSVLNGAKNFADDTRRRVLKAAADLEYTPNLAAKLMRRGPGFHERPRTNVIAFVTRMLDATSTDPYTGSRFLLLAHLAEAKGYYMVPIFYDRNTAFACPPVQNGQVDGVVAHLP
ncbi:MAG: LacI family DNA-binding transcriptional regulator, partial [Candidatus Pacebacteria bacterium]|nr:LacI family DNA-binding transcriptional regulator [Candidatus Paceibacterota bacterium]